MKPRAPWYKDFQILAYIGGGIVAVGAISTGIVAVSKYITLPERVEAAEKVAQSQQKQIDELKAIEETWQKIYQQQQHPPPNAPPPKVSHDMSSPLMEQEMDGTWWCCDSTIENCWKRDTWFRCEER